MHDAKFRRERDALQSRIDELLEKLRRLTEILEAAAQIHEHDDGADSYYRQHRDPIPVVSGDDFYPGNDNPSDEPEEYPMQWEHHQYNHAAAYDDTFGQELITTPDGTGHLQAAETVEAAGSGGDNGGQYLLSDPALYDDDHDMTAGEATPARFSDGGFGGVPASAAAIAGLKKQRHDGSSGADNMCIICMRHYKKGKRLYVMPCAFKHRFHRKCLKKWLSRSHLCPLCRHALPTNDQGVHRPQARNMAVNDQGVHRSLIWLSNVN
ncbi:hypothetical protein SETIT_6G143700v2 [Setaria italica]|uniref:RING-type domain-containing protein n=1 Tax=Setaria italica TaxID=4555 RepID=A0A368RLJ6_SETIT|nr:hypothetical protein SETIT_6G143700v2 [Setaria italica]